MIRLLQPPAPEFRQLVKARRYGNFKVAVDALPDWLILDQGLRGLINDHPLAYRYGVPFLIVYEAENAIVGNIGGKGWLPEEQEVELGYHTARAYRGRGIMTAAIAAVQELAREDGLGLLAHVEMENAGSRRVLIRNGFTREAIVELPDSLQLERWGWSPD
ncbi:RimJ/RimL family protein N-acetyltransferase [Lewinella marina]|uniref:N-acetyltransferase domain-containing protein n=1 Tax=Neolewinella marina TaxID=438751 RepID=A0A2G0CI60_9BACT|nr:GNAT family N-acetyltransferase [Neolewinella marina]NJB85229.1 RimJ/RimL family protein N-acetyltransferase [Neolewinella marina]PHK99638.1 hypothetical protein CGL56_00900 [Neolewinella marina]